MLNLNLISFKNNSSDYEFLEEEKETDEFEATCHRELLWSDL